jgi:imidazolonepropionase-like amidohydrolase
VAGQTHELALGARKVLQNIDNREEQKRWLGVPFHEVAELVRAGMPPLDAIKSATSLSAECLGVERRTGTIKPGMTADLIAVDSNPLADISALQDLVLVIHDGKVMLNRLNP